MSDHEAAPVPPTEAQREHAEFRARESPSGIGAAVTTSSFREGTHRWDCIVTDGQRWHYVYVLGPDLGPFPSLPPEAIEDGIERFAAQFPPGSRMDGLLDANPLHIDGRGIVHD